MSVAPFLLIAALAACIGLLTVTLTPARRSLFAAFIVVLAPLPVLADAAGGTTVDLSGIAGIIVSGIAAGVLWLGRAAVSALVGYIQQRTRLDLDDHTRAYLDAALRRAVTYAETRIDEAADASLSAVDLHNVTLAHAVNYVIDRVPDALAHFGITPSSLADMVEARMMTVFGSVVADRDGATVFQDGPAAELTGAPAGG